jgi:hypothetical protein
LSFCVREGVFQPKNFPPVKWNVNANGALIWGDKPYLPRGLHVSPRNEEIQRAHALGFRDIVIDVSGTTLPANEIAEVEKLGMRYMLSFRGLAPACEGVAVEPQGYRVDGISENRHIEFPIPGATSALVVLAIKKDGSVVQSNRVKIVDGRFVYDVAPVSTMDHVLLVYPIVQNPSALDYWENFDSHRDKTLLEIKRTTFGPGFRGFINPMGKTLTYNTPGSQFVPLSRFFQYELKQYMLNEYRSFEMANKAWSLNSSDLETIDQLCRLVPLWSGSRGIPQLWDPVTDRLYGCNSSKSLVWRDINLVVANAAKRRYLNIVSSIRKIVDVPIVQDWSGWSGPYRDDTTSLVGIGSNIVGRTNGAIIDSASRAASSNLMLKNRMWQVASELQPDPSTSFTTLIEDLTSLGYRGWFLQTQNAALLKQVASFVKDTPEDATAADWAPHPLFYPENAMYPAVPQRLPSGYWWLPSPVSGNRIDLGTAYSAYRYEDGMNRCFVMWSNSKSERVKLYMTNPKAAIFRTIDGTDPDPKVLKDGVEVTIGEYPVLITGIDEIPVPQLALAETISRFDQLLNTAEQLLKNTSEERFFFKDNTSGFTRNPGGSFAMLRLQYWKLNYKLGAFTWNEAELPLESTFSETPIISGCSNNSALSLNVPASTSTSSWFATYKADIRSSQELEIWISAKIPEDQWQYFKLTIGDQVFSIKEPPISYYSSGFGWYRLGVTKLPRSLVQYTIEVMPHDGVDLAIDSILLYPGKFTPSGSYMPDAMEFATVSPNKKLKL